MRAHLFIMAAIIAMVSGIAAKIVGGDVISNVLHRVDVNNKLMDAHDGGIHVWPHADPTITDDTSPNFAFSVDWSSGGAATQLPAANFSVRKLAVVYNPGDGHWYGYADIVEFADYYYPDSYDSNVGAFSSPDGLSNWTYHGIVVARGASGSPDAGGCASPGAAVVDNKVLLGYAAEPHDGGAGNREIAMAVADHPLGPFVKQQTPVARDVCGGTGRCDDVIMQTHGGDVHLYHSVKGSTTLAGCSDPKGSSPCIRHVVSSDGGATWVDQGIVLSRTASMMETIAGKWFPGGSASAGGRMVLITDAHVCGDNHPGVCLTPFVSADMQHFVPAVPAQMYHYATPPNWAFVQIAFVPDADGNITRVSFSKFTGRSVFSHHKNRMSQSYTHEIYRLEMTPQPEGKEAEAASCTSQADCSLNGDCTSGTCVCDAPWAGSPACDVLAVRPTAINRTGYSNASAASWGGNALFSRDDGLWHLFVAQMMGGCGLEHYGTNSAIVRATSADPAGPYKYAQTVVAPFAHNPTIRRLPNGEGFVIFFIGGNPTTPASCNASEAMADAAPGEIVSGSVHTVTASRIAGPWSSPRPVQFDDAAGSRWTGGGTNPSPHVAANGTVTLALQRPYNASGSVGKELLGVARASSWRGPFAMLTAAPVDPEKWFCLAGTGEDPFLWRTARGWHMVFHGMCPTGVFQAHYAFSSDDARTWTVSKRQTYPYDVQFSDGSSTLYARVERPQLIFAPSNLGGGGNDDGLDGAPTHLVNGVCAANSLGGIYACLELKSLTKKPVIVMTHTLVRPLA